jgi:predicted metal-dependent phosphoesterase TrpH
MVDLHSHSTASDGRLSPTNLVALAASRRLTALALTDHDTVAGLAEAERAAEDRGIRFVPGIELEVESDSGEFHLLGLGIAEWNKDWARRLDEIQVLRDQRNRRIFAKMTEAGIRGDYDEVKALAKGGQVGRPHFAQFLVNRGKVETIQDAFTHFLGAGRLFYEKKAAFPLPKALQLVHDGGGLAVVAHPMSLQLNFAELEAKLETWKAQGLDGVEAWHPGTDPRHCRRLETIARCLKLKVSAGSDFHGENRPDRQLGLTSGGRAIDESVLEELLA